MFESLRGHMETKITFVELAERQKKILANQKPITFEEAKEQVNRLRNASKAHVKVASDS